MSKLDSGDKKAIMKIVSILGLSLSVGFHFGVAIGAIVFFSMLFTAVVLSEF
jgi:hypothetical protein